MLVNYTISEFLNETASKSPAPGGGSVSALAGALGAALSSMVCNLSTSDDRGSETTAKLEELSRKSHQLMSGLQAGIDRDTEAFNQVMAAYKLPKSTDEEKQKRSASIQQAMKAAADEPFQTAVMCLEGMKMAFTILQIGNKNAASDAAVSGLMAYAGLNGALFNVKINLSSIKDIEYVEKMKCRNAELGAEAERTLLEFKTLANEIIG
jgi:methenyltetrahydrofolate cyclohydrolase